MKESRNQIFILLLLSFLALLPGCKPDYILDQTQTVIDGVWDETDVKEFAFEIADTTCRYDVLLDIQHADTYGFQNLYVKIHTFYPQTESKAQPLSIELADKVGKWHGKCRGGICRTPVMLQENVKFTEIGKYRIALEPYMRMDPVQGINALKLMIQKHQDQK